MNEPGVHRVALYARQSKADPMGIDRQLSAMRVLVRSRGWEAVESFVDDDVSASASRGGDTAWARMLAAADAGKVDTVVAVDLDRLVRSTQDLITLIDHGLVAVTLDGEIDLSTGDGEFRATMLAAIARFEVRRKSERQVRASVQRARRGQVPSGMRPLGYATDGAVIEREADVVREIFRLYASYEAPSLSSIARALSGEQSPSLPSTLAHLPKQSRTVAIERNERRLAAGLELKPVPNDGAWSPNTIRALLANPRYAGYAVYTGKDAAGARADPIVRDENGDPVRGRWEPIVDEAIWRAAQRRLAGQAEAAGSAGMLERQHLGSGLYLCDTCRSPLSAHSRSYRCRGHIARSRDLVDAYVLDAVAERIVDLEPIDLVPAGESPHLLQLRTEVVRYRARLRRVEADYDAGFIEAHDLARVRRSVGPLLAELEDEALSLVADEDLAQFLASHDRAQALRLAPLKVQRKIVATLYEVRLKKQSRGRKGLDPDTVVLVPRR